MISVLLDYDKIIHWLVDDPQLFHIALEYMKKYPSLSGPVAPFLRLFVRHFHNKRYQEAANIIAIAPSSALRHPQLLKRFTDLPTKSWKNSVSEYYFGRILQLPGPLFSFESIALLHSLSPLPPEIIKERIHSWILGSGKIVKSTSIINHMKESDALLYTLLLEVIPEREWIDIDDYKPEWGEDVFEKYGVADVKVVRTPSPPPSPLREISKLTEPDPALSRRSMTSPSTDLLMSPIFQ